jgi:hypothetical protein
MAPPPPPLGGGAADDPPPLLGTCVEGTPPFAVVVPPDGLAVPPGVRPVGPGVLLAVAEGVPAVLLDAPDGGDPPSLLPEPAGVSPLVLEDDATDSCRCGELLPTTVATTPTTATTATAAQTLRCANHRRL